MTGEEKISKFTKVIRSRNRRELAVGAGLLVVFGYMAASAEPGTVPSYGSIALFLGVASVLAFLLLACGVRGDPESRSPGDLERWQGEYRRHARLLRLAPLWYELPLLPGMAILAYPGCRASVPFAVSAMAVIAGAFAVVAWLNLRAARRLEQQAEDLARS